MLQPITAKSKCCFWKRDSPRSSPAHTGVQKWYKIHGQLHWTGYRSCSQPDNMLTSSLGKEYTETHSKRKGPVIQLFGGLESHWIHGSKPNAPEWSIWVLLWISKSKDKDWILFQSWGYRVMGTFTKISALLQMEQCVQKFRVDTKKWTYQSKFMSTSYLLSGFVKWLFFLYACPLDFGYAGTFSELRITAQ